MVRLGEPGLEPYGLAKTFERFLQAAEPLHGLTQAEMRLRLSWRLGDRPTGQLKRVFGIALLQMDKPEQPRSL